MPIRNAALAATAATGLAIVLGAAAVALAIAPARAAIYKLENVVYPVGVDYVALHSGNPEDFFGRYPITLTISDGAVQRGSFDYHSRSNFGRRVTGDVADFIRFSLIDGPPGDNVYQADIDLKFDGNGVVTSGSLFYGAETMGVKLTCSGVECSGYSIIGASSMYHAPISGQLLDPPDVTPSSVPEPWSLLLLLTGFGVTLAGGTRPL